MQSMTSLEKLAAAAWIFAMSAPAWAPPTNVVPEPGTLGMLAIGLAGLVAIRNRRRK
jgi:hypothetical protein